MQTSLLPPMDIYLAAMQSLHDDTLRWFDAPASVLEKSYAPGKWTVRQMLIHVSDTECVFLERLRRITAELKPLVFAMDPDRWQSELLYLQRDLALAGQQFSAARRSSMELVRLVHGHAAARVCVHSEAGRLTFADQVNKIIDHHRHHLEQIVIASTR